MVNISTGITKPRIVNHKLFDPQKEHQREDYFYSLLLMFVPFRSEASLLHENETAVNAFGCLLPADNRMELRNQAES